MSKKYIISGGSLVIVLTVAIVLVIYSMGGSEENETPNISIDSLQNNNVQITTDKPRYNIGETVRIKINNQNEQETYVWSGPCSLILERYNGNVWDDSPTLWSGNVWKTSPTLWSSPTSWSGCPPACGASREMPIPRFLSFAATEEIEWNQKVVWCKKNTTKKGTTVGRFRFVFRYAEDEPECQFTLDPLMCWQRYNDPKWHSVYSNEFTIREHGDLLP